MPATNLHATALVLGGCGVMITGPSGSGKTTLALTLIRRFNATGALARLVGDDQLFVRARGGRLIASCPGTIAGLAEVHGLGPRPLPYLESAVIDLIVTLVEPADAPRFSEPLSATVAGITLPRLDLPARRATASSLALAAWLKAAPFR